MVITQEQQNARNLILKATPPGLMDFDPEAFDKSQAEARVARAAAEVAANPPDPAAQLRAEYEDLARRVKDQPTEQAYKTHANEQAHKHQQAVQDIEDELKYVKSLLDSPAVSKCVAIRQKRVESDRVANGCSCDAHVFRRKIVALEIQLRRAKNDSDKSIRVCGNMIREAAEVDKLRPRHAELEKMFRKIDTARKVARDIVHGNSQGMVPEQTTQRGGFHFTKD
jgi:hypothetical protein